MARGAWQPLSAWCKERLPARGDALRLGQPVGPYRLDMMLAARRKDGAIEVGGHPREPRAKFERITPGEWAGYRVFEEIDRVVHVDSGLVYYRVKVREVAPGAGPGRPSLRAQIAAAFTELRDEEIDLEGPINAAYPAVRRRITGSDARSPGLKDEALRKVIGPLFKARKSARKL